MIKIILSELDFDYELQALVNSFFSGQRSSVEVGQELTASSMKEILSEKKEKLVLLPEERPFYLSVNAARPDLVSGIPLFSHAGNCYCF